MRNLYKSQKSHSLFLNREFIFVFLSKVLTFGNKNDKIFPDWKERRGNLKMNSLGEKILNLLDRMKMSQKQLADLINTSESNLSRYISGERNISTEMLANIATALHTTTDFLLGISDKVDDFEYKDVERILARKSETMTKEEKKRLLDILFGN